LGRKREAMTTLWFLSELIVLDNDKEEKVTKGDKSREQALMPAQKADMIS
jgi:hypothetical protein